MNYCPFLNNCRECFYTNRMKVLLVQPPVEDYYDTAIRTYPLGLAYVAASIEGSCVFLFSIAGRV